MTASNPQQRYTAVAIALHWIIALAIIGMIGLGWYMTDIADRAARSSLVQLHKATGVTILALSVGRIVWRLMNKPPAEPAMPGWQKGLALFVHTAFYVLIVAMPLSGWIMVSAAAHPYPIPYFGLGNWPMFPGLESLPPEAKEPPDGPLHFIHSKLAWVIIVLLALHIAGALKHQFVDKDGLLARMAPGLFGRTDGPPGKGRGLIYAAGAALLLLAGGVAFGTMGQPGPANAAPGPQQAQQAASAAPQWRVDAANSSIKFRFTYKDAAFDGGFAGWTADIRMDPAAPQSARIHVSIPMGQATTAEADFTDQLKEQPWFDPRRFPTAKFDVNEDGGVIQTAPGEYEATGVLTIKDQTYPLRLPFKLAVAGSQARMHAEISLKRLNLALGASTPTSGGPNVRDWVGDEVAVVIDVVAERQ